MLDLKKSGLDIQFDAEKKTLILEGKPIQPSIRKLKDIKDVIYSRSWLGNQSNEKELYYMYRGIAKREHEQAIKENSLRYDVTIIPPAMLGQEYIKTAGHNHPLVGNTGYTYTELYEVIKGEAIYIMQKTENDTVTDAYMVRAKAGDIIIIPPGYAHITINPTKDMLVMSNWVSSAFSSEYEYIKDHKGACLIITTEKMVKNPAYENDKQTIKVMNPNRHELLGLKDNEPIYKLIETPFRLSFLNEPENHKRMFEFIESRMYTKEKIHEPKKDTE